MDAEIGAVCTKFFRRNRQIYRLKKGILCCAGLRFWMIHPVPKG